jgi:hypothetical protein
MGDFSGHPFRGNQYSAGQKYYQIVPEITHLPADMIRKQHDDDREVASVSDLVARSIEASAKAGTLPPIDISVFASGEVIVSDGHHRLAAAKQRGFVLPVRVNAVNARGEKINDLIRASKKSAPVKWTPARDASRRTKLEHQIQKGIREGTTKLPDDPFEGFRS